MKKLDLSGKIFGKLLVQRRVENNIWGQAMFQCLCECGKTKVILGNDLKKNINPTKSCGCTKTHGMKHTRFWRIWSCMRNRCYNKNFTYYKDYGGRGITVCEEWSLFERFRDEMYKSYLQHVEDFGETNTTIERKDNCSGYYKENCRWATRKEQAKNRRNDTESQRIARLKGLHNRYNHIGTVEDCPICNNKSQQPRIEKNKALSSAKNAKQARHIRWGHAGTVDTCRICNND